MDQCYEFKSNQITFFNKNQIIRNKTEISLIRKKQTKKNYHSQMELKIQSRNCSEVIQLISVLDPFLPIINLL